MLTLKLLQLRLPLSETDLLRFFFNSKIFFIFYFFDMNILVYMNFVRNVNNYFTVYQIKLHIKKIQILTFFDYRKVLSPVLTIIAN